MPLHRSRQEPNGFVAETAQVQVAALGIGEARLEAGFEVQARDAGDRRAPVPA